MQKIRDFSLDQAIRATAGAGKTTGLISAVESCYKSHLAKKGSVPYILLTTFTIKAANELSERILDYALKKEDRNFLNYVSSHFLEVGTMHSTFMKVLSHISSDETEEDLNSFESTKLFYSKKLVHKVVKDLSFEDIFELVGSDKEIALIFIKMFEHNYLDLELVNKKEILSSLKERIKFDVLSGPEPFAAEIKELFRGFNEVFVGDTENFFSELNIFKEIIKDKVSKKCKREEKAYYRKIIKTIDSPDSNESFLNNFVTAHEKLLSCYKLWKPLYQEALDSKLGFGISDIEWRLFKDLEKREDELDLWDYCFFDEYQDTNPIQKKVIEQLTKNTPCYFVGDPFQSIYYFRGARKDIFLNDFENVKKQGGSAEFRLDNYRSSVEVVDFVNLVCVDKLSDFKPMVSKKGANGEVVVFHNEDFILEDEFKFIHSKILKTDLEKESFAILCRNVKELMLCARFLKSKGIDVSISLSKSFESSLEVVDLCGLLRFINYPHDNYNFLNLMRSPWFEVSDEEIKEIVERVNKNESDEAKSYWTVFKELKADSSFHRLIEDFKNLNCNEVIANFLVYSNFLNVTENLDKTGKREINIWKFISILQTEEDRPDFDAGAFIQDILNGLYPLEKESSESESGCLLMTVHASKGLQFDHVAILASNKSFSSKTGPYLIDEKLSKLAVKVFSPKDLKRVLPDYFSSLIEKNKFEVAQESRRLLYVAMTRAVKNLYITGSGMISKNPYEPSWLKIILDFKDSEGFVLTDQIFMPNQGDDDDLNQETKFSGFLINNNIKVVDDTQHSAVTKQIQESDFNSNQNESASPQISKLSTNIVRGTLFHEFVERSGANQNLESDVNNFFDYERKDNHEAFRYLQLQTDFPFNDLMSNGGKEWGFDYINTEGDFSSGKIDLWGLINDELWLIDFKTGQTKFLDKGFMQLEFYSKVLKSFLRKEKLNVKLVLTFPFEKKTKIKEV